MADVPRTDGDLFSRISHTESWSTTELRKTSSQTNDYSCYATVAVDEPVDDMYDYGVPSAELKRVGVGSIVEVSFGGKITRGCVVATTPSPPPHVPPNRIKPIRRVLTPEFRIGRDLLQLARWMSEYYLAPLGQTLACVSFLGFQDAKSCFTHAYELACTSPPEKLTPKQQRVLSVLHEAACPLTPKQLCQRAGVGISVLTRLAEKGVIQRVMVPAHARSFPEAAVTPDLPLQLNCDQAAALFRIREAIETESARVFVLRGVTGSGKTEVYLQAIGHVLHNGKCAIVLVPEISLTPQTVSRFRRRFGDVVGVYHSMLSTGEKYELWQRIRSGTCRILVGARSALFAPFENLGIVVVDEEHETSYKQDSTPRYNARDVAVVRGKMARCPVVLGSATPSLESYFNARQGKYELLELPHRIEKRPLPDVTIVDMTQEVTDHDNPAMFSTTMLDAIRETLAAQQQVLVFLNRRGYFNFAVCLGCKNVVRCERCDVALTYHKVGDRMVCHYCNYWRSRPTECPECGATDLALLGLGTQRVEEELQRHFPDAPLLRLDLDTMRRKHAYSAAWRKIQDREVSIIVGTQIIAKGLHLENVALVVVPLADVSLFQPDFRAAERAFSILTQVAGRTGRGTTPGQVIIQTYVPYHYAIQYAQTQDYVGFFEKELQVRKVLRFPPHYRLIAVLGQGKNFDTTKELFHQFASYVENTAYPYRDQITVLGPTPAPLARLENQYRWRLLLRGVHSQRMREILRRALVRFRELPRHSQLQLMVDVDPLDLL